ncbi:HU family DNA-binding protein [Bacteroides oleiciplenus]|uniref:DNA-binding protein n=1 Tax=Bacteroides oleiciplenus TaxID=626931 RepID=A0A3E5BKY0_9BACE|nr:DsbA family protein [Bacteroides oleiciplenus]RGN38282.1 DNA-binding protein [Bacteroides oleiciplenus]
MSLRYVVRKRVFGFDKTKAEKFVAESRTLGLIDFKELCEEVTKVGLVPSGAVKFVLDALIDTLKLNINKGFSVQLGDFGCFRPGINAKSQDKLEDVTTSTIRRRKIIFSPGTVFQDMLRNASLTRMVGEVAVSGGTTPDPDEGGEGDLNDNPLG